MLVPVVGYHLSVELQASRAAIHRGAISWDYGYCLKSSVYLSGGPDHTEDPGARLRIPIGAPD